MFALMLVLLLLMLVLLLVRQLLLLLLLLLVQLLLVHNWLPHHDPLLSRLVLLQTFLLLQPAHAWGLLQHVLLPRLLLSELMLELRRY
jgi:hypothetical protein